MVALNWLGNRSGLYSQLQYVDDTGRQTQLDQSAGICPSYPSQWQTVAGRIVWLARGFHAIAGSLRRLNGMIHRLALFSRAAGIGKAGAIESVPPDQELDAAAG
jgi:hypothetical protein